MALPPQLSVAERRAALERAAAARKKRSLYKAEIKSGVRKWTEALSDSDPDIRKMRVRELLESIPGYGSTRSVLLMERVGISPTRRIQGVGANQLRILLRLMKEVDPQI